VRVTLPLCTVMVMMRGVVSGPMPTVAVIWPSEPVALPSTTTTAPLSAVMVTGASSTTWFDEFTAVTIISTGSVEPFATEVGTPVMISSFTLAPPPPPQSNMQPPESPPPPPQATNIALAAKPAAHALIHRIIENSR
jgi:hypothetical protein